MIKGSHDRRKSFAKGLPGRLSTAHLGSHEWACWAPVRGRRRARRLAQTSAVGLTFLGLRLIQRRQNTLPLTSNTHGGTAAAWRTAGEPTWMCLPLPTSAHICSRSVSTHHLRFSAHCNCIHSASACFDTHPYPASVSSCVRELGGSNAGSTNSYSSNIR